MAIELSIGELAHHTGTKVPTIRYYEEAGLLPPPARTAGNQRRYTAAHLERLTFVRHARALGFELEAIRELLSLSDHPDQPCANADEIARRHRNDIETRVRQLKALQRELDRMIKACSGGKVAECRIMGILSDHGQCLSHNHASADR